MDWTAIFTALGALSAIGTAIVGWYVSANRTEIDNLRAITSEQDKALTAFQIKVAENYVTTHDLAEIKDALVRIEGWIRGKS